MYGRVGHGNNPEKVRTTYRIRSITTWNTYTVVKACVLLTQIYSSCVLPVITYFPLLARYNASICRSERGMAVVSTSGRTGRLSRQWRLTRTAMTTSAERKSRLAQTRRPRRYADGQAPQLFFVHCGGSAPCFEFCLYRMSVTPPPMYLLEKGRTLAIVP